MTSQPRPATSVIRVALAGDPSEDRSRPDLICDLRIHPGTDGADLLLALEATFPGRGTRGLWQVERTGATLSLAMTTRDDPTFGLEVGDRLRRHTLDVPEHERVSFSLNLQAPPGIPDRPPWPLEGDTMTIGRDGTQTVCIEGDRRVSGQHARLDVYPNFVLIESTGRHGTMVTSVGEAIGRKVTELTALREGDVITVGSTRLYFDAMAVEGRPDAAAAHPAAPWGDPPPPVTTPDEAVPQVPRWPAEPLPERRWASRSLAAGSGTATAVAGVLVGTGQPWAAALASGGLLGAATAFATRRMDVAGAAADDRVGRLDRAACDRWLAGVLALGDRWTDSHPGVERAWDVVARLVPIDDQGSIRPPRPDAVGRPARLRGTQPQPGRTTELASWPEPRRSEVRDAIERCAPELVETTRSLDIRLPGASAHGLARWVVLQALAPHHPRHRPLVVITDRVADWAWATWLPHAHVLGGSATGTAPCRLDDTPGIVATLDGLVRGPDRSGRVALVWACSSQMPPALDAVVARGREQDRIDLLIVGPTTGGAGGLRAGDAPSHRDLLVEHEDGDHPYDSLDPGSAAEAARYVAHRWATAGWPIRSERQSVAALVDLLDDGHGSPADDRTGLIAVLGRTEDQQQPDHVGPVTHDLSGGSGHLLVSGGASDQVWDLLATVVLGILRRHGPDTVGVLVADSMGATAAGDLDAVGHSWGRAGADDLDRFAAFLDGEVERRSALLGASGAESIADLRRSDPTAPADLLVVVVDVVAVEAQERWREPLLDLARIGRKLGLHLLMGTSRSADAVSRDVRGCVDVHVGLDPFGREGLASVPGRADVVLLPATTTTRRHRDHHLYPVECSPVLIPNGPTATSRRRGRIRQGDDRTVLCREAARTWGSPEESKHPWLRPFERVEAIPDLPSDGGRLEEPVCSSGGPPGPDHLLLGTYDEPATAAQGLWYLAVPPGLVLVSGESATERALVVRRVCGVRPDTAVIQGHHDLVSRLATAIDAAAAAVAGDAPPPVIVIDDPATLLDHDPALSAVVEQQCLAAADGGICVIRLTARPALLTRRVRGRAHTILALSSTAATTRAALGLPAHGASALLEGDLLDAGAGGHRTIHLLA